MRPPQQLIDLPQWVCWKLQGDRKVPYSPKTGRAAKTNDASCWATYDKACLALDGGHWSGVGFVFTEGDGLVGVDLDNAVENGKVKPWARDIVDMLDSYTEVSPSGLGLHVIVRGAEQAQGRKKDHGDGKVEVYSWGRYFTWTGEHLEGTPTEINEAGLRAQEPVPFTR